MSLKKQSSYLVLIMIEIFILSLVQGVTEFLPVSSSSHLIILSEFINFKNQKSFN